MHSGNQMLFELLKTIHIIAMVAWFAGLFYLPRLFVYHSLTTNQITQNQFKIMEHKLFWYIMTPSAIVTIIMGELLAHMFDISGLWLHLKVFFVITLIIYHVYCFKLMDDFAKDCNQKSHRWFRVFNEYPTVVLIICVGLVIFKPF
ncbi:MAG: protoporphyrinogen oxidase HemJ [Burkholderiales bacterium]|nr:protoporphyrinogen oxidase HemJ [Burkholderiales bacterium]